MAKVLTKRSSVSGVVPLPANLDVGELAVNTADGKLFTKHTDNSIKEIGGSSGGGSSLVFSHAKLSTTQAFTTTTYSDATDLVLPLEANGVYQIECFITFQSAATTTGAGIGLLTPSGCRNMVEIVVPITSTAAATQLRTIFPNAAVATNISQVLGTGVTAINSNHTALIRGIIRNGNTPGNCRVQIRSEVANSAITLQIGSELQLIKVA